MDPCFNSSTFVILLLMQNKIRGFSNSVLATQTFKAVSTLLRSIVKQTALVSFAPHWQNCSHHNQSLR